MYTYKYLCNHCTFSATAIIGRLGYYVDDSGTRLQATTTPAWCESCRTITCIEELVDAASTEEALQFIETHGVTDFDIEWAALLHESPEDFLFGRKSRLETYLRLFKHRQSPAKCIECGSSQIASLMNLDDHLAEAFPHPNCQGTLHRVADESRLAQPTTYFFLSSEGTRLPA